jgi:predicted nucleic acid-binding Zn ribbon protein
MPTYVYKFIDSGETVEVQQSFSDATLTELAHPADGTVKAVKKVFQPVGVTFKGNGFYKTDSRNGSSSKKSSTNGTGSSESNGSSPPSASTSTDGSSSSKTSSTSSSASTSPSTATSTSTSSASTS